MAYSFKSHTWIHGIITEKEEIEEGDGEGEEEEKNSISFDEWGKLLNV